jgi:outer membrane protein OmpA-like peptidoglycan-associated protein
MKSMVSVALATVFFTFPLAAEAGAVVQGTQESVTLVGSSAPGTTFEWLFDTTPLPTVRGKPLERLTGVGFASESIVTSRETKGAMIMMMEKLRPMGDLKEIRLLALGFTSSYAEGTGAQQLGLQRAEVVRDFLVTLGLSGDNIQVASFGDDYATARPWELYKQTYEQGVAIWLLGTSQSPMTAVLLND